MWQSCPSLGSGLLVKCQSLRGDSGNILRAFQIQQPARESLSPAQGCSRGEREEKPVCYCPTLPLPCFSFSPLRSFLHSSESAGLMEAFPSDIMHPSHPQAGQARPGDNVELRNRGLLSGSALVISLQHQPHHPLDSMALLPG